MDSKSEKIKVDPKELKRAKEVINALGKAFSLIKVYPEENPSVKASIESFAEKLEEYLKDYEELNIAVAEFSFFFKGETIFKSEEKKKSLPFLFFKDGMRELSFFSGIDKEEVFDFLEIVKTNSDLPPEDSDIINSLWECDFVHIRYFAIDEFLESDIGSDFEEVDLKLDAKEFSVGTTQITPEDKREIKKRSRALGLQVSNSDNKDYSESLNLSTQITSIREDEKPEIEFMLASNRDYSRLAELVTLLFEILYLEDRYEKFFSTLNVLEQCLQEAIHKADFTQARLLLNQIQEFKEALSGESEDKGTLLEKIIARANNPSSIANLKKVFQEGRVIDFDAFLQYVHLLGSEAMFLVGDIWEIASDPLIRLKASNFLSEFGKKDIESLVGLAQEDKVLLTKEIISVLARIGGEKVTPHLKKFIGHKNKAIRLDTIQALGKINDEVAHRIVLEFLSDEDEEVRTVAAMNLRFISDKDALNELIQLGSRKDFKKRNKAEKKAILMFLAKSEEHEAYKIIKSVLGKSSIFSKPKLDETRLCAISALEEVRTPEAIEILKEGALLRNKTLKQACKLALRKINE
jgi:HEAT repeat protein